MKMSLLARVFLVADIYRAMIVSAILIGLFCGLSTVEVHKLKEKLLPGGYNTTRVDYYRNREIMIGCIVIGITMCGSDILMALALDHILRTKNIGGEYLKWLASAGIGVLLRSGFYILLGVNEVLYCLNRMNDFTPGISFAMQLLFNAGVLYEVVKVIELLVGVSMRDELGAGARVDKFGIKMVETKLGLD